MEMTRIFLIDDHPLFRHGLKSVLNEYREFQVVGEAASAQEALPRIEALKPDIVITDIFMPGIDGIKAASCIKQKLPTTKVIVLTFSDSEEVFLSAIKAGAKGYLLKGVGIIEIIEAIKRVACGQAAVSPALANKLLDQIRSSKRDKKEFHELSSREKEILKLTAKGSSNKEIAADLYISDTTVKAHMRNILEKLQVKNRAEAVGVAISKGILNNRN
jgi:DNA-binding NarL/FixJ family response regulator